MRQTILNLMEAYGIERVTEACCFFGVIDHREEVRINSIDCDEKMELFEAVDRLVIGLGRVDGEAKQHWFRVGGEEDICVWGDPEAVRHQCTVYGLSCERMTILQAIERDLRLQKRAA